MVKSTVVLLALGSIAHASHVGQSPSATNANHIFNALHSSMRQWGSSVLHNGMSVFIATVPEGIQLYHGTSEQEPIQGTQWLTFEPEHALVFARSHEGSPPDRDDPPHENEDDEEWHSTQGLDYRLSRIDESPKHELKARHANFEQHEEQHQLSHTMLQRERADSNYLPRPTHGPAQKDESHGYLHTYRSKHNLQLLYLDGESAAKSEKGTLDLQDMVLLHGNPPPRDGDHRGPPSRRQGASGKRKPQSGPMNEMWRAEQLCKMAENKWHQRIDGFLRMEMGFEIILCSFKDHLDVERITQADSSPRPGPPSNGPGSINYYKAVASRFDGIGGNRVTIDYGRFVTLFSFENAISLDEHGRPRVNNDTAVLAPVRNAIDTMILQSGHQDNTNWQATTDMVISRYSDRTENLASGSAKDLAAFRKEVDQVLKPFIDYGKRNSTAEVKACATQHLPQQAHGLAAAAILNVTSTLCLSLLHATQHNNLQDAVSTIRWLKHWLNWTTFKRCRGCSFQEVCFVPIWPTGGEEDMRHPKCISNMSDTSGDYWSHLGGPSWHGRHERRS